MIGDVHESGWWSHDLREIEADGGHRLPCDGRSLCRAYWPELAAVLRDQFGSDRDTFRVPDLRWRGGDG